MQTTTFVRWTHHKRPYSEGFFKLHLLDVLSSCARIITSHVRSGFASLPFEQKLDRLAEVAVRIGLNLRSGQELLITAPTEALPLVRLITSQAYKAGAKLVTPFISDEEIALSRYRDADDSSF